MRLVGLQTDVGQIKVSLRYILSLISLTPGSRMVSLACTPSPGRPRAVHRSDHPTLPHGKDLISTPVQSLGSGSPACCNCIDPTYQTHQSSDGVIILPRRPKLPGHRLRAAPIRLLSADMGPVHFSGFTTA